MINKIFTSVIILLIGTFHDAQSQNWYKGNMHTHSLWSDGSDFPEEIAELYKSKGYNFLGLTEHNLFQEGVKWVGISSGSRKAESFKRYMGKYGNTDVDVQKFDNDSVRVRLKALNEYRNMFEEDGKFLLINSEEITSKFNNLPAHVNAINLQQVIKAQEGENITQVLENANRAVIEQGRSTGKKMFSFIDHPNFHWALTAEDIMKVRSANHFEVFNGGSTGNYGDETRDSVEVMWDKINFYRLTNALPLMYGVAVDDSHGFNHVGRAWVVVNAPKLEAAALVESMLRGNYYFSTGVEIEILNSTGKKVDITIKPEKGVTYTTQFIGMKKGQHKAALLKEITGVRAVYSVSKNDLFVRAKIFSSKVKQNPFKAGDMETAWTQPVIGWSTKQTGN